MAPLPSTVASIAQGLAPISVRDQPMQGLLFQQQTFPLVYYKQHILRLSDVRISHEAALVRGELTAVGRHTPDGTDLDEYWRPGLQARE